jgi:hypothetical protein
MSITVGDYVRTTEEYNSLCSISGKVIEDYGNKVVIIDDCAETDDDTLWEVHLEFHKSDLEIVDE